jgi:hypothetical protein
MQFRIVTLNLEQDHKRWSDRHPLISAEIAGLRPDVIAFNEVSVPLQTARLLRDAAIALTGIRTSWSSKRASMGCQSWKARLY